MATSLKKGFFQQMLINVMVMIYGVFYSEHLYCELLYTHVFMITQSQESPEIGCDK